MRLRTIAAVGLAAVLVAGVATLTRGQDKAKPGEDRAKLRERVADIRAGLELGELELDADATHLKSLLRELRDLEGEISLGVEVLAMRSALMAKNGGQENATTEAEIKKRLAIARRLHEKLESDYARTSGAFKTKTQLFERVRLELADAERAYKAAE
jgi:hypothetical protein